MASRWAGLPLVFLLVAACSGNSPRTAAQDAGTQGASCSAPASKCTLPPPPGSEPPNKGDSKTVIAISKLYLGDTDRQGNPDPNAWKSIGYDLDGLISRPSDENHCTPQPGANPMAVKTDGEGGIDNSFGENLLPLIDSLAGGASASADDAIAHGATTELFRFDNLVDPAQTPDQNGITGSIYVGANKGSPALFDGSDVWPVTDNSVVGANVDAPKATFSGGYVSGGMYVGHSSSGFVLPLYVQGDMMLLPIRRAIVTMQIHGTGTSATAVDGTIAGTIDMATFIEQLRRVAGAFDPALCDGPTFESIAQQIRVGADIMSDGTNGDPARTCNAISVGIGFEGTAVTLGSVAAPTAMPDTCPPSGN